MRRRLLALILLLLVTCATTAFARVGGGQSYSGGGGHGGGGGDDGGGAWLIFQCVRLLFWLTIEHPVIGIPVDIVVIIIVIRWRRSRGEPSTVVITTRTAAPSAAPVSQLDNLRRFDPNFSEIVFTDFCYSLYGRVQNARGSGTLDQYAPYLSDAARSSLVSRNPPGLREVRGIVVGSFTVGAAQFTDSLVTVNVDYESNLTEISDKESTWYLRERWTLERKRDILSPPPGKAKAEHCPRCGAALRTCTDGSCEYCGVKITDGAFQWYVRTINVLSRETRGPLLTSNVTEQGTDRPTRLQSGVQLRIAKFQSEHPEFQWSDFEKRAREIATELQNAWGARDWERVRPLESETLFQTHRYWIDAYIRQHLRNVVDGYNIWKVEPVKITSDPFYDALTVRMWVNGHDYTVDDDRKVVAGSVDQLRSWSEYWTLIRSRAEQLDPSKTVSCPNCGASVVVGTSGVCQHCGGKLTSGEFGWVLSRIEQDEAYGG